MVMSSPITGLLVSGMWVVPVCTRYGVLVTSIANNNGWNLPQWKP